MLKKIILSNIFIYPIKSLSGISLQSSQITGKGLKYDRRWMLVDENNKYITQRTFPEMSLLNVEVTGKGLLVFHKLKPEDSILIPFQQSGNTIAVKVWSDECKAKEASNEINEWFSEKLKIKCKLVFMPDDTERIVDKKYVKEKKLTSFSDGYPFLIIGQSSLDLLNTKLETPVSINRFRPNFVFTGGEPHVEDTWGNFKIGSSYFQVVKPCARCVITTVNQESGIKGKEPLATLSKYRSVNNKVLFGQNLICKEGNFVKVGDTLEVM